MKIIKLLLPGSFEDAFLYMGHVVAFPNARTIQMYSLQSIVDEVGPLFERWPSLPKFLFERNDMLTRPTFRSSVTRVGGPEVCLDILNGLTASTVEVRRADRHLALEHSLETNAEYVLDVNVYNGRVYIATESGLFHQDLEWDLQPRVRGRLFSRLRNRTLSTAAGFGSLSASCEEEGLFVGEDDFGWIGEGNSPLEKVADASMRAGWLSFDLVNYPSSALPSILRTRRTNIEPAAERNLERERHVVTDIGFQQSEIARLLQQLEERRGVALEDVESIWNSRKYIFVKAGSEIYAESPRFDNGHVEAGLIISFGEIRGRVVSASPIASGTVVETHDSVLALVRGETEFLHQGEAILVRSFSRSKWYQRLVAIIVDEGILLTTVIDEGLVTGSH